MMRNESVLEEWLGKNRNYLNRLMKGKPTGWDTRREGTTYWEFN